MNEITTFQALSLEQSPQGNTHTHTTALIQLDSHSHPGSTDHLLSAEAVGVSLARILSLSCFRMVPPEGHQDLGPLPSRVGLRGKVSARILPGPPSGASALPPRPGAPRTRSWPACSASRYLGELGDLLAHFHVHLGITVHSPAGATSGIGFGARASPGRVNFAVEGRSHR